MTVGAAKDGLWRLLSMPASGEGATSVLLEGPGRMYPNDWTPDGRFLVFQEQPAGLDWDLRLLEVDAAGRPAGPARSVSATPFREANGAISPDGTQIAYESDEVDGVVEVYVRAFPDGTDKVRVEATGARWPRWGADGRLYYWSSARRELRVVRVSKERGRVVVEGARPVFGPELGFSADQRLAMTPIDGFDLDRSGRFLVLEPMLAPSPPTSGRPVVVVNWGARRAASARSRP